MTQRLGRRLGRPQVGLAKPGRVTYDNSRRLDMDQICGTISDIKKPETHRYSPGGIPDVEGLGQIGDTTVLGLYRRRGPHPCPASEEEKGESEKERKETMTRRWQKGYLYRRGKRGRQTWYGRYYVHEIEPNGQLKRVQKAVRLGKVADLSTKREAQIELGRVLTKVNAAPVQRRMTFRQFVETVWRPSVLPNRKASTQNSYQANLQRHLLPFFGNLQLVEINYELIQFFVEQKSKLYGSRTVRNLKFQFQGILKEAQKHGLLENNPATLLEVSRRGALPVVLALTAQQAEATLLELEEPYRTVALCAWTLGLRKSEIRGLRWEDIDFENRRVFIRRAVWRNHVDTPKSAGSKAVLPLPETLRLALLQHWKRTRHADPSEYVFAAGTGNPLNLDNAQDRILKPALKKLGLWKPRMGWHTFRRAFCTHLQALGVDSKTLQMLARHADAAVTLNHYVQAVPEFQRRAMDALDDEICANMRKFYLLDPEAVLTIQ